RYLVHLLNAGKLDDCAGICLAEYVNCTPQTVLPKWHGSSLTIDEIFEDVLAPLGIPVMYGLPLGHGPLLQTVPLGVRVRMDASAGRLHVLEPGVTAYLRQRSASAPPT